jgi:hypothetical protein
MKRRLKIKRYKYQTGGLSYMDTTPKLLTPRGTSGVGQNLQLQSSQIPSIPVGDMQQHFNQQIPQQSFPQQQSPQFGQSMRTAGSVGRMLGSGYYGSQMASNQGEQAYNATMGVVSQAGPIGGVIGGITAIGDAIGKPIRAKAEEVDPNTGGYADIGKARRTAVIGGLTNPLKALIEHPNYKKKDKEMRWQKQLTDWNSSLQKSSVYRQQNPQYNYNPTFATGGDYKGVSMRLLPNKYPNGGNVLDPYAEIEEKYADDPRLRDLDYKDWLSAVEGGNKKNYPNLVSEGELKDKARLYYYSQQLNKKLREKNPDVYTNLQERYGWKGNKSTWDDSSDLSNMTRVEGAESYAKQHPDFYLSPEEQRSTLDKYWDDYNTLRGKYGKSLNLLGSDEDPNKPETWKVGARHSVAFNPSRYGLVIQPENEKAAKQRGYEAKRFDYNVEYDPSRYSDDEGYNISINRAIKKLYQPEYQMYARGGYNTNGMIGNAELEDEEIFRVPDGTIEKVNGRTHAQGGEVYNLPENTEILGKNIAPNGKSYKENGDKLIRQFNKYTNILEDKPTALARNTAAMMLDKIQNKYTDLMNMQEMEKGYYLSPDEEMEYACGGITPEYKSGGWIQKATASIKRRGTKSRGLIDFPMYEDGDITSRYDRRIPTNRNSYSPTGYSGSDFLRYLRPTGTDQRTGMPNPIKYNDPAGRVGPGYFVGNINQPEKYDLSYDIETSPRYERTRFIDEPQDKWYNKAIEGAGQYAPIAYNLYQGLFGKAEQEDPSTNPYEPEIRSLMRSRRYNVDPELEANRLATANYYRNLRQAAPSQGRLLSGLQSGQIGRQRSDAEAYARKQNMDNQYIGEEAQTLMGLSDIDARSNEAIDERNERARAAQKRFLPTALSQLQQQTQVNKIMREKEKLMRNKALRDEERQRIMEEYFKGYNFNLGGV